MSTESKFVSPDEIRLGIYGLLEKKKQGAFDSELLEYTLNVKNSEIRVAMLRTLARLISTSSNTSSISP